VPLESVAIDGPLTGNVNVAHTFSASVSPLTATQPITYLWQATGQDPLTHTDGPSDTVSFNWSASGVQTITVAASNAHGIVTGAHVITITPPPETAPLESVAIDGPLTGNVNVAHTFSASVSPLTATQPIVYLWQATAQSPVAHINGPSDIVNFDWSASGVQAITVTVTNAYSTVTGAHVIIIAESPPGGDAYEPDDTCTQAQPIPTDGSVQVHTFNPGDKDWVSFQAATGVEYLIEAHTPLESWADVVLELYDACGNLPDENQDYSFSPNVRLRFQAHSDGPFYLRLSNHDPGVGGADISYELSVRALADTAMPGALVLVAGRLRAHDPLQNNIHSVTNDIYRLFLNNGYTTDRIYYLAADLNLDRRRWNAQRERTAQPGEPGTGDYAVGGG